MSDDGLGAARRRRRWPLLAPLALAAALLGGGLAWRGRAAGSASTTPAAALTARALAQRPTGDANAGARTVTTTASGAASPALAGGASAATPRDGAGTASVCDLAAASAAGPVAASDDDDVPAATLRAGLRDARQALRTSADPEVRALAVLLDARGGGDAAELVAERAALAREAAQSHDHRLYRMALLACSGQPAGIDGGACRLLDPARWAQLDGDNAMPWLAMLTAGNASGSTTTDTSAALFHAVHAARIDDDFGLYPALVERGLPADAPRWLRQRLQLLALGLQAAEPAPQFFTILRLCSATALADANRAQDCDTLARHLVTRGRTLMALLVARRVGERLHWRADRLQALARQAQAVLAVEQQRTLDAAGSDCASVERQRLWLRQIDRLGEMGAAQAAIDASGLDSAHWAAALVNAASAAEAASAAAPRADD